MALFVTPVIAIIPSVATTSALVMIGIFMMQGLGELDWKSIPVASTALVTLLLMTLTSVSDGLAIGFLVNLLTLAATGSARTIKPFAWALAALFVAHYLIR